MTSSCDESDIDVFAGVVPQQQLQIVNVLEANAGGCRRPGDGPYDAPALKAAHIGIAVGGRRARRGRAGSRSARTGSPT